MHLSEYELFAVDFDCFILYWILFILLASFLWVLWLLFFNYWVHFACQHVKYGGNFPAFKVQGKCNYFSATHLPHINTAHFNTIINLAHFNFHSNTLLTVWPNTRHDKAQNLKQQRHKQNWPNKKRKTMSQGRLVLE